MPVSFQATVKGFRADNEGFSTLTLNIPLSDRDAVYEVSKKIQQTLLVTVFELHEVGGKEEE